MFDSLLVLVVLAAQVLCGDVEVATPLGIIKGTEQLTDPDENPYYSFKGIKYGFAERFERPNPVKPWNGIYDASEDKPSCIQTYLNVNSFTPAISVPQSEDCLYLTVSTPKLPKGNNFTQLPVMFWIHGGFFAFGNSRYDTYGPDYFMDSANVVLVTFNYRLGAFGFLSSGDGRLSGNQGIKDAILALHWVKDNIAAFGGDPDRVTIMGQSIGAALASYIIQSPLTIGKNLFHRAITESGSSLCSWGFQKAPLTIFWNTAFAAGCNYYPTYFNFKLAIGCLKNVTADVLKSAILKVSGNNDLLLEAFKGYSYAPSIEQESSDAAITKNTHELLTSANAPTIPMLTGITTEESGYLTKLPHQLRTFYAHIDLDNTKLVPDDMYAKALDKHLLIAPAIREFYFHGLVPSAANVSDKIRFLSDHHENRPWREYINVLKNKTNVHCYLLSYQGPMGGNGISGSGVEHGEDCNYLFRTEISKKGNFTQEDFTNRKRMIRLWTNYATYGNPTPNKIDPVLGEIQWPPVQPEDEITNCLLIGNKLKLIKNPKEEQYQFWRKMYDTYGTVRDVY